MATALVLTLMSAGVVISLREVFYIEDTGECVWISEPRFAIRNQLSTE